MHNHNTRDITTMNLGCDYTQQILEHLPDQLYILDQNLIVLYVNPAMTQMLDGMGLPFDLKGKKFSDVFPGTVPYLQKEIDAVYATRKPMRVEHTVFVGGEYVSYETVRIPMVDSKGAMSGVLNSIHNVTNYLKIQRELNESRQLFETMVDNANSIIMRIDLKGIVTYVNKFAETFFGYLHDELIGCSVQATIIPPTASSGENLNGLMDAIVANPSAFTSNENENICKDGTRVWISWSNKPIIGPDGSTHEILCVGNDITALKKAQLDLMEYRDNLEEKITIRTRELRESEAHLVRADRLASLGTLVSGVAHEINNPNNFIALNADNLQAIWSDVVPVLDEKVTTNSSFTLAGLPYPVIRSEMEHLIDGIRSGSRRIRTIVTHLKEFARQGPIDMNQDVDCVKVLDAAQVIVSNLIRKSTVNFKTEIGTPIPIVKGDFQKLEQVIINLLTNACQALTSRDQAITVRLRGINDGRSLEISVVDQGRGIDQEHIQHIFDPFFTTKREFGGTGLGLSISYGIIKDHKGSFDVTSNPGTGTVFTITLPAQKDA